MHIRLASLGFGNVGQALAVMLTEKADLLKSRHGLTFSFTGAYTRRSGAWIAPDGVSPADLAASGWPTRQENEPMRPSKEAVTRTGLAGSELFTGSATDFAAQCPADVVLELTTLNPQSGQPAIDHIRAALTAGRHVVTANKGPIAYAYRELRALAQEHGVALRFESAVIDGTPIFNMVEASLPVTVISGFRGLINSTSNYVLGRMALGESLEEAIREAQRRGIAEANPANDLEGWDAAVKVTILANVLMDADLRPTDVQREGLGAEAMRQAEAARQPGQTLKQMVTAQREGERVTARVAIQALPPEDFMGRLSGMEAALQLHTDTMQDLTLVEGDGGPGQTAFGVLADLVTIARKGIGG